MTTRKSAPGKTSIKHDNVKTPATDNGGEGRTLSQEDLIGLRRTQIQAELRVVFNALAPSLIPTINQLQSVCFTWNDAQGFWESSNFGEKIALIHSEVSECLEANRNNLPSDHLPGFSGEAEELADILLRVFDLAGAHNIPLGAALIAKLQYNLTREKKHGKAY